MEPLSHRALLEYLESRCIDRAVATEALKQVEFSPADKLASYFALGWPNGNGFEVRNKYFKGFVGTGKTVSLLNIKPHCDVLLFEGFMDYLSYLTLLREKHGIDAPNAGVIVLNSTSLRARALSALSQANASKLYCFFDHDEAGRSTLDYFQLALPETVVVDKSPLYAGFKDFNAWWSTQSIQTPKKDN